MSHSNPDLLSQPSITARLMRYCTFLILHSPNFLPSRLKYFLAISQRGAKHVELAFEGTVLPTTMLVSTTPQLTEIYYLFHSRRRANSSLVAQRAAQRAASWAWNSAQWCWANRW